MAVRVRLSLFAAVLATLLALAGPASGARAVDTSFSSVALGGRLNYEVYLPTGYATSGLRYPVLYFLHGLPAASTSYRNVRFVERALEQERRPAILVVPQGARPGERDPEYVDHGPGDDWGTAIGQELPHMVDARFRTIAGRRGRALIGNSAGGYGAMHLALKHLDAFAVVESWSGYFHPTDPTGTKPLSLGSPEKDARADVHEQIGATTARLRSQGTFVAFYVGRSDSRFAPENVRLDRELTRAQVPHVFRVYAGGHTERLWHRHAAAWLGLALDHLASAR